MKRLYPLLILSALAVAGCGGGDSPPTASGPSAPLLSDDMRASTAILAQSVAPAAMRIPPDPTAPAQLDPFPVDAPAQ